MREELRRLRHDGAGPLGQQGALEVFVASADAIPTILHEIGRLREISFREVGEGSGKELDLDDYDRRYLHLFLWDNEAGEVAGAYRLGRTDRLLADYGPEGLYCSTLFEFEEAFLAHLTPGLELGRSFVAPNYQRSLGALMMLWKGIGQFVARHPCYARLFGPVSISRDYTSISKNLIVRFLREEKRDESLAPFVHPTNPYRLEVPDEISPRLESIEQVSARVAEVEPDGKGVPVLLRQYLKLNATLLEFNVDPQFCNCLDALLMVDLRTAPEAILKRYMGKAAYQRFREGSAIPD
ncbi:MAG: GNAT family N-acetyltransferase [Akkermansiaceae bacterium]|nr:GNAT family N-acetyltransferase [Akkermansiaceae bacterium]